MNPENRSRYHTRTRVKSKTHILMLQLARPWASLVPALPLSLIFISLSLSLLPRHTAALSLSLCVSLSLPSVMFHSCPFRSCFSVFLFLSFLVPTFRQAGESKKRELTRGGKVSAEENACLLSSSTSSSWFVTTKTVRQNKRTRSEQTLSAKIQYIDSL